MGQWTQDSWFMGSLQLELENLTVHGQAVVEVVTTAGFYSNSGRISEVERNERESAWWMDGLRFIKSKVDLLFKRDKRD